MANSNFKHQAAHLHFDAPPGELARLAHHHHEPTNRQIDAAIDAALRSVSLPKGLITRLGVMVHSMPDESGDPVDWLGC